MPALTDRQRDMQRVRSHRYYRTDKGKALGLKMGRLKRDRVRAYTYEFKLAHPCLCGESDPAALDFHHCDPAAKEININLIRSLEQLKREIAKCIVICANCHRKGHAGRPSPWHSMLFNPLLPCDPVPAQTTAVVPGCNGAVPPSSPTGPSPIPVAKSDQNDSRALLSLIDCLDWDEDSKAHEKLRLLGLPDPERYLPIL